MSNTPFFPGFGQFAANFVRHEMNKVKAATAHRYEWHDIVEIDGKHYAEHFPISGRMYGDAYEINDFLKLLPRSTASILMMFKPICWTTSTSIPRLCLTEPMRAVATSTGGLNGADNG